MHEERFYRKMFNTRRFKGFEAGFLETDLWIGVDADSYNRGMRETAMARIRKVRQQLDFYIKQEPEFAKTLLPFIPAESAPALAKEMAAAGSNAGVGPMASVAGLFAREAAEAIRQNFSVEELVIENGGDIYALLNSELVLSVYAGKSPLSEKIGVVIPSGLWQLGICTSSGTVGPSLSLGNADAVAVVCHDVLLADAFATAIGNMVKHPEDIEGAIRYSERFPEILAVIIICGDKTGMKGIFEIKFLP
jgi:uncharacterized protein